MTAFHLSTTGADRERWISLLDALPNGSRDIHFHPDYMRIYERTYPDQTAHLLVYEGTGGTICKPIVSKGIPGTDYCDISSVYGYGGPLTIGSPTEDDLGRFDDAVQASATSLGAISEFCLLHPLLGDAQKVLLSSNEPVTYRKEVVVVDLSQSLGEIWRRIEDRQRKAALAARKAGLVVRASDLSEADIARFQVMYLKTMENVGARAFWHFPDDYFHNCAAALGFDGTSLFHAEKDGEVAASVFHIHMYDTVYYHFSCSDPDSRQLNATSLLLLDSLIWAKGAGYRWFHLGGGRTDGEDPLFTFKRAFSGETKPLFSTQRILDTQTYDTLTAATKQREASALGQPRETSFFPRYRLQT
ncbi:GNAT family N-acetyltransferase [uncultured Roseobacter sp.]|uniref:GNAT family N-acetyltransferase n=1 Tax=uncultured Roseobacter sp. TaxID=114847 RepID=UPI00260546F7|nr:GNAT family N-acetyltransferase [uncultured Roseobacter sp.]